MLQAQVLHKRLFVILFWSKVQPTTVAFNKYIIRPDEFQLPD